MLDSERRNIELRFDDGIHRVLQDFCEVITQDYGRLRLPVNFVERFDEPVLDVSRDGIIDGLTNVFGNTVLDQCIDAMHDFLGDISGTYADGTFIMPFVDAHGNRRLSYASDYFVGSMISYRSFVFNCFIFCIDKSTPDMSVRFSQADRFFDGTHLSFFDSSYLTEPYQIYYLKPGIKYIRIGSSSIRKSISMSYELWEQLASKYGLSLDDENLIDVVQAAYDADFVSADDALFHH